MNWSISHESLNQFSFLNNESKLWHDPYWGLPEGDLLIPGIDQREIADVPSGFQGLQGTRPSLLAKEESSSPSGLAHCLVQR